jgi:fused signal recognition particle receptor
MHSLVSLEEVLRQDTSQTAAIKSDLFQSNKEYQRLLDDVKELKESSINREKREQEKQAKEEMHQKEADLANARSHLKQLSDDLQSTLNRAATEAKALGDMSKELNDLKVKLAAEEEERRKQAELSKRELEELQKEDADLDARLAQIEAQKQLGLEQLSRFNRFLSTHDNNKKKLLAIVDEKAAKLDMLEQLEKCDDETRNQLKASLIRLEEAKNSKAASEKIRIANDEKEKSILLPAKEELRELESKKQDLTSNISLVHSELEEQELKESEELERMISEKADLEAKIDVMNKRVKLKTMEEEATTNAHMKWMEDIELQISQQRKREHTFNQAIETTEKETYKVNKKEAEDSYMAKIESMKMKFKMKERSKHRYHSILKTAAEMLDDVLATELEADANPGSRGADEDEETDREY